MKDNEAICAEIEALKGECAKLRTEVAAMQKAGTDWMKLEYNSFQAMKNTIATHKASIDEVQKVVALLMRERGMRQVSMFDNILLGTPEMQRPM